MTHWVDWAVKPQHKQKTNKKGDKYFHFRVISLSEAVLTSNHNLCFELKYDKFQKILSENFPVLVVKFSVHLNRRVFIMK